MKRIITLVLAAGLVFGAATGASAIDFNAKGQWIFGFGATDTHFMTKDAGGKKYTNETFNAQQRVRLQMDAVASEALSGTVFFEIGEQMWGRADKGAALGADGTVVEVKRAYLDWTMPNTDLKIRMGLQGVTLPNVAGGSSILDDDVAGITMSYKFNENVALTALWARPYNDNYIDPNKGQHNNFLDNADLFALMLPVTMDGFKVTPWVMAGATGRNSYDAMQSGDNSKSVPNMYNGFFPGNFVGSNGNLDSLNDRTAYGTVFFAGLPIGITALDPFNFELDINYGSFSGAGRYDTFDQKAIYTGKDGHRRADSKREGWLVKGLAEYKTEWVTPGIFAWYGSGDDSNVKNGSERMPDISPSGNFTSFMGDDPKFGWAPGTGYDNMLTYSGTWGVGLQLKDISFAEDLKHTFRAAYWGGTNSTGAVKYLDPRDAFMFGTQSAEGFYLTTNDYLLEFNLDTSYKIYDNLEAGLLLGYIVNGVDRSTWKRGFNNGNQAFAKGDAYKADVVFSYSF